MYSECNIDWIFEKELDCRFILLKTQMNRSLWILWLLLARTGSELNLEIMMFIQMIHFKVKLPSCWWLKLILLRNGHFWGLDSNLGFKSQSQIKISYQFGPIILARIGFEILCGWHKNGFNNHILDLTILFWI